LPDHPASMAETAEVSYWTAVPARRRGVATAALRAVTAWAFGSFSSAVPITTAGWSGFPGDAAEGVYFGSEAGGGGIGSPARAGDDAGFFEV